MKKYLICINFSEVKKTGFFKIGVKNSLIYQDVHAKNKRVAFFKARNMILKKYKKKKENIVNSITYLIS